MGSQLSVLANAQGKIIDLKDDGNEYLVEYDDSWTEWTFLGDERFKLVSPRATSAGCSDPLLVSPHEISILPR